MIMRHAWLLSMLLAGCDLVYGLDERLPPEARPGDEDGDGTLDDEDSYPHLANESSTDRDDDNISIDCDPDDNDPTTMFRWFPLTAGSIDELRLDGIGKLADDGFVLGDHDGHSALVFDVDADTAIIDVGFEILSSSVEDDHFFDWSEIGVTTVHRAFTTDRTQRGDTCFYGVNADPKLDPPVGDAYLEMNEDDAPEPSVSFASPVNGTVGRLHEQRTPDEVVCSVVRTNTTTPTLSFTPEALSNTSGKIAITAERMVAKLTYAWIAWQPL